jgi:hypothetical protein
MTVAMRRLHARLPEGQRYPLPPREITERLSPAATDEDALRDQSLAAHFFYGAAVGALIALTGTGHRLTTGAMVGAAVWAASYLGWVPALGVLRQAGEHPARRNALMIGVHLIWGAATTLATRELAAARDTIMSGGSLQDAPRDRSMHSIREGTPEGNSNGDQR